MKPTVGRVVHFLPAYSSRDMLVLDNHYAAIVTHVHGDELVNLFVFSKDAGDDVTQLGSQHTVPYAPANELRKFSWHWPEKV